MRVMSSFTRSLGTLLDTLTQVFISTNHLARAASYRTQIVEEKSVNAAGISRLRNHYDVARTLQTLKTENRDITQAMLDEGKAMLDEFRQHMDMDETPAFVSLFTQKMEEKLKAQANKNSSATPGPVQMSSVVN